MDTSIATLPSSDQRQGVGFIDDQNPRYLPIPSEYLPLFVRLTASCRVLRERSDVPPEHHALLAKLHEALARLPVLTWDVDVVVVLHSPNDPSGSWQTYTLEISQTLILANQSWNSGLGNMRPLTQRVFYCESSGYRHDESNCSLVVFEKWVRGWEELCNNPQLNLILFNRRELFNCRQVDDPLA